MCVLSYPSPLPITKNFLNYLQTLELFLFTYSFAFVSRNETKTNKLLIQITQTEYVTKARPFVVSFTADGRIFEQHKTLRI
jgi:hypothetical protein